MPTNPYAAAEYGGQWLDWQDVASRAFKTFVQSALAVVFAAEAVNVTDIGLWRGAVVAGAAAAGSVVWNSVSQWLATHR